MYRQTEYETCPVCNGEATVRRFAVPPERADASDGSATLSCSYCDGYGMLVRVEVRGSELRKINGRLA